MHFPSLKLFNDLNQLLDILLLLCDDLVLGSFVLDVGDQIDNFILLLLYLFILLLDYGFLLPNCLHEDFHLVELFIIRSLFEDFFTRFLYSIIPIFFTLLIITSGLGSFQVFDHFVTLG